MTVTSINMHWEETETDMDLQSVVFDRLECDVSLDRTNEKKM